MVRFATPMPSTRILPGRLPSGRGGWGRRKGAGEHDSLVIAVALADWMGKGGPVRSKFNSESANLIIVVLPTPPVVVFLIVPV